MLVLCFLGVYGFILFSDIRDAGLNHRHMLLKHKARILMKLGELKNEMKWDEWHELNKEHNIKDEGNIEGAVDEKNKNLRKKYMLLKIEECQTMIETFDSLIACIPETDPIYKMEFYFFQIPATKNVARSVLGGFAATILALGLRYLVFKL